MYLIKLLIISMTTASSLCYASNLDKTINELNKGDTIYVITNRISNSQDSVTMFSNKVNIDQKLTYTKVIMGIGNNNPINLVLTYDEFMLEVSQKTSDWLLFIHGDGKTYKQSIKRGLNIQKTHNINVIVFSWPSEIPSLSAIKNLKNSQKNVSKSSIHFIELLNFMHDFKKSNDGFNKNNKLSILLHSLGNLYLEQFIKNSKNEFQSPNLFDNLIINSAAVREKKHTDWVEKLNFQKRIYIASNKSDFTLKGKHIFTNGGNQLGEKTKRVSASNAKYINFSKAVGFRFPLGTTHTYFIGSLPERSGNIHHLYSSLFHGSQINLSESTIFKKKQNKCYYSIIF